MTNDFSLNFSRLIIQIKFRPTLKWLSDREMLTYAYEKSFKDWSVDENRNLMLFSQKEKFALEVYPDTITYVDEGEIKDDRGIKLACSLMKDATRSSDIVEIRRIGVRRIFVYQSKFEHKEIANLLYRKVIPPNKSINELQPGNVSDYAFLLDTVEDTISCHTQISALSKQELVKTFVTKFSEKIDVDNDKNLMIDIDTSRSELVDVGNFSDSLNTLKNKNKALVDNYFTYLTAA